MKKLFGILSVMIAIVILMAFSSGGEEVHSTGGAPAGYAGDPAGGNKTCNTTGCHTGAPIGNLTGAITSNIPAAGYTAGSTYTVSANLTRAGHSKFGFEATPQNSSGTKLGTLANITANTQLTGTGGKYITHTSSGVTGTGSKTWNFRWTAPATGLGPVTFYAAFNATNSNNNVTGDSIFKSTLVVTENTTSVQNIQEDIFSFSVFPNPTPDIINLKFTLPEPSEVEIDLFDVNGNKINNLSSEMERDEVNKYFNISSYPQGIYFLRLEVDGISSFQKIVKI